MVAKYDLSLVEGRRYVNIIGEFLHENYEFYEFYFIKVEEGQLDH